MMILNKLSARNYIIDEKLLQKYEKSVLCANHFAAYDLLDELYYGNLKGTTITMYTLLMKATSRYTKCFRKKYIQMQP